MKKGNKYLGLYLAVEGCDGSGKGTLYTGLMRVMIAEGYDILGIAEPKSSIIGPAVYKMLSDNKLDPLTQLFLFLAARRRIVIEKVRPALEKGKIVLSDRSFFSSLAYQGYGGGMGLDEIRHLCGIATEETVPQLVILLDIPPEIGLERTVKRGEKATSFEQEKLDYHKRVREGYLKLADMDLENWTVIDAILSPEEVLEKALKAIYRRIRKEQKP